MSRALGPSFIDKRRIEMEKQMPNKWVLFILGVVLCSLLFEVDAQAQGAATESASVKKRIAVMRFESTDKFGGGDVGEGLSAMLSNELSKSGRFIIVERAALPDILGEQTLAKKGLTTPQSGAKTGKLLGAQILVRGTVTDFESSKKGGGGQISLSGTRLPIGGVIGGASMTAHIAIDLRLIDATTGEIIDTYEAEGEAKGSSSHFGISHTGTGLGLGTEQFKKTPLGKAARNIIKDMVARIIEKADDIPWTGRISDVSDGKVYVNAGKDVGLSSGDTLNIYVVSKEITDPETGAILGVEEHRLGSLRIDSVKPKYSTGTLLEGSEPKSGDIVRIREES